MLKALLNLNQNQYGPFRLSALLTRASNFSVYKPDLFQFLLACNYMVPYLAPWIPAPADFPDSNPITPQDCLYSSQSSPTNTWCDKHQPSPETPTHPSSLGSNVTASGKPSSSPRKLLILALDSPLYTPLDGTHHQCPMTNGLLWLSLTNVWWMKSWMGTKEAKCKKWGI